MQKQLRKAVASYRETNFFKAICCYSKVSSVGARKRPPCP